MFLLVGLFLFSMISTMNASETPIPSDWKADMVPSRYFFHLSPQSIALMNELQTKLPLPLADICHQKSGDVTRCNELISHLAYHHFFSAKSDCKFILERNPRHDRLDVRNLCENLEEKYLKWEKEYNSNK